MVDMNVWRTKRSFEMMGKGQLVKVTVEFTPPLATSPVPTHPLFIDSSLMPLQTFNGII